jgi:hypothetical protein
MSYTMRDGKRIHTVGDDFGITVKKRSEPWVKAPLRELAAEYRILGYPGAVALLVLRYEAWKAKGKPFALPNKRLNQCGVGREVKRRTLTRLENAGVIRVERNGNRAPVIQWLCSSREQRE